MKPLPKPERAFEPSDFLHKSYEGLLVEVSELANQVQWLQRRCRWLERRATEPVPTSPLAEWTAKDELTLESTTLILQLMKGAFLSEDSYAQVVEYVEEEFGVVDAYLMTEGAMSVLGAMRGDLVDKWNALRCAPDSAQNPVCSPDATTSDEPKNSTEPLPYWKNRVD